MNDQINYEAEVKKVRPDAYCSKLMFNSGFGVFLNTPYSRKMISVRSENSKAAWQSAYNTLKQQGKFKL